jgi:hypothetical protein
MTPRSSGLSTNSAAADTNYIEGDFTAFLGVALEPQDNGSIHMHQTGLVKKLITAARIEDANPNWTPASTSALGSDHDGPLYDHKAWQYSSIIGMLIYMSTNARPDISFAVSQVARFSKEPRESHVTTVKTIV